MMGSVRPNGCDLYYEEVGEGVYAAWMPPMPPPPPRRAQEEIISVGEFYEKAVGGQIIFT